VPSCPVSRCRACQGPAGTGGEFKARIPELRTVHLRIGFRQLMEARTCLGGRWTIKSALKRFSELHPVCRRGMRKCVFLLREGCECVNLLHLTCRCLWSLVTAHSVLHLNAVKMPLNRLRFHLLQATSSLAPYGTNQGGWGRLQIRVILLNCSGPLCAMTAVGGKAGVTSY
jgi:hypothetical protein